jgi:hypothetical protein
MYARNLLKGERECKIGGYLLIRFLSLVSKKSPEQLGLLFVLTGHTQHDQGLGCQNV